MVSLDTNLCSRSTIEEASTTGSTAMCGIEPWLPFAYTVILSQSPADRAGPAVVATVPRCHRHRVLGEGDVRPRHFGEQAVVWNSTM